MAAAREARADDDDSEDSHSFSSSYKGWADIDEPMQVGRGPVPQGSPMGHLFSHQGVGLTKEEGSPRTRPGSECQLRIWKSAKAWGTPEFLHKCAHQKLLESPFDESEVADLRKDIITMVLKRQTSDRRDLPVNWRLFGLVLAASEDVDAEGVGSYASGVAIGVGVKLPRIPSFQKEEKMAVPIPAQTARAARGRNDGGCLQGQLLLSLRPGRWWSKTRLQRGRHST